MEMVLNGSKPLGNEKNRVSVPDELTRNYREMDETGRETFLVVLEKFHEIYNKIRGKKMNEKTLSDEEIRAFSLLLTTIAYTQGIEINENSFIDFNRLTKKAQNNEFAIREYIKSNTVIKSL
jgi:hypothetical protein